MNIVDYFAELYGYEPDDYYLRAIRSGIPVQEAAKDYQQKLDELWACQKKDDGFYPVIEKTIPDAFK